MEKRNVATEARVRDSESMDNAISTASRCIGVAQATMKKANDIVSSVREMAARQHEEVMRINSLTKRAMDEDEAADRETNQ